MNLKQKLRQIANGFRGRKISLDKDLDLQEALTLLGRFDKNIRGTIRYRVLFSFYKSGKISLKRMADSVGDEFSESENFYNKIRYQVYSGKRGEKRHYLDLACGRIKGVWGLIEVERHPFQEAYIKFDVKK